MLQQLKEYPLCPFVILGIGGIHLAGIVKREAQLMQLLAKMNDIFRCYHRGVYMVFNGVVFCRQTKRIVPDGVKHVIAFHATFTGDNIHCCVAARMPYMQPRAAWVGKLYQRIILGLIRRILRLKCILLRPFLLPFLFQTLRIVRGTLILIHAVDSLLYAKTVFVFNDCVGPRNGRCDYTRIAFASSYDDKGYSTHPVTKQTT